MTHEASGRASPEGVDTWAVQPSRIARGYGEAVLNREKACIQVCMAASFQQKRLEPKWLVITIEVQCDGLGVCA